MKKSDYYNITIMPSTNGGYIEFENGNRECSQCAAECCISWCVQNGYTLKDFHVDPNGDKHYVYN